MRERADEIIKGIRILRYILHPEKVVIAIEDNKPEAISAIRNALQEQMILAFGLFQQNILQVLPNN